MTAIEFGGALAPQDSQTIRVLPVVVPEGTQQIAIDLTYDPRIVEDRDRARALVEDVMRRLRLPGTADDVLVRFWPLRSLLNIAVFDPRGRFRGRWDRNRSDQSSTTVLAERRSSPGMVDGAIPAGTWRLALEVHQVLVPLEYKLRVTCSDALTDGPRASGFGLRKTDVTMPDARRPTPGWLVGELHCHSEHSDGKQPVSEIADALAGEGLDFFALTDHNTTSGLRDLPAGGLLALPGLELTTFYGHATCLGIRDFVPWYVGMQVRSLRDIAAEVHAAGGLVCVAHPFSPPTPLCGGCRWVYPQFSWDDADLLEIWNGDLAEHAVINEEALTLWDRLLNQGRHIAGIAGSDMHDIAHLRVKRYARTLVQADDRSPQAILGALKAGRAIVSCGPQLGLVAAAGDRSAGIGDTLVVQSGARVVVSGKAEELPGTGQPQLVIGGERIPCGRRWEHPLRPKRPTWIRADVTHGDTLLAVTNPIYIDVIRES